eukprot:scaffold2601_cov198-Pinguiococcus_pyrenoidosus.AAC.7
MTLRLPFKLVSPSTVRLSSRVVAPRTPRVDWKLEGTKMSKLSSARLNRSFPDASRMITGRDMRIFASEKRIKVCPDDESCMKRPVPLAM